MSLFAYGLQLLTECINSTDVLKFAELWKLVDLGTAKANNPGNTSVQKGTKNTGTEGYQAPEAEKRNQYGPKTDIYSFGRIVYELMVGELPKKKSKADWWYNKPAFRHPVIGEDLQSFLEHLMHVDHDQRPSPTEALIEFANLCAKANVGSPDNHNDG